MQENLVQKKFSQFYATLSGDRFQKVKTQHLKKQYITYFWV